MPTFLLDILIWNHIFLAEIDSQLTKMLSKLSNDNNSIFIFICRNEHLP